METNGPLRAHARHGIRKPGSSRAGESVRRSRVCRRARIGLGVDVGASARVERAVCRRHPDRLQRESVCQVRSSLQVPREPPPSVSTVYLGELSPAGLAFMRIDRRRFLRTMAILGAGFAYATIVLGGT